MNDHVALMYFQCCKVMASVLVKISTAVLKHHDHTQAREEKVCLYVYIQCSCQNPLLREVRAGTQTG